MKYILEYNSSGSFKRRRGSNPADELGWADEILSHLKKSLIGKTFKNKYLVKDVEISEQRSESSITDVGEGNIIIKFKNESSTEMDTLLGDLYDIGLDEGTDLKLHYFIDATLDDDSNYDIEFIVSPINPKNPYGFKTKSFYNDSFDPSLGVGKIISDLILKGLS